MRFVVRAFLSRALIAASLVTLVAGTAPAALAASQPAAVVGGLAPHAVTTSVVGSVRRTVIALNARGHPTTTSKSLFTVRVGTAVRVYRTATDSSHRTWYLVHVSSRPGWIAGWLTVPVPTAAVVKAAVSSLWHSAYASSYGVGDGLVGHGMACGGVLTTTVMAVANLSLPCGTHVLIRVGSKTVTARVLDRGPYVSGRTFDLGPAVCHALGACYGVTRIEWQTAH